MTSSFSRIVNQPPAPPYDENSDLALYQWMKDVTDFVNGAQLSTTT